MPTSSSDQLRALREKGGPMNSILWREPRAKKLAALLVCTILASLSAIPTFARSAEGFFQVAAPLPAVGGTWTELTTLPYDLEDPDYRAPEQDQWYPGSGYGLAGGRVQALAVDGDTVYAGAADGGVWRSSDGGRSGPRSPTTCRRSRRVTLRS